MVAPRGRGVCAAQSEASLGVTYDRILPSGATSSGAGDVVPAGRGTLLSEAETLDEARSEGPGADWQLYDRLISAALRHERRWRAEADRAEWLYFGPDRDPGPDIRAARQENVNAIDDLTALIHANIDVLRPLIYSDAPQPIVRRRHRGDGATSETAIMAAEAGQRLAEWIIEDGDFDAAMQAARDDWLIAGRGSVRALYKADFATLDLGPEAETLGLPAQIETKTDERVCLRPSRWRRLLLAPSHDWHEMPWIAFEVSMSRRAVEERFGADVAAQIGYDQPGLSNSATPLESADEQSPTSISDATHTGTREASPHDVATVWEIWDRTAGRVVWWCASYKQALLAEQPDPLGLSGFFPMPRPLLASTRAGTMTPRPDIAYYERRAEEVNEASRKLASILRVISVSGLFPGQDSHAVKQLLDGENKLVPVEAWLKFIERGGMNGMIQWLPLDAMIAAMQALLALREAARQAMFEASGVSDVMRAESDPNETATAQQIKGRYAGMRLMLRQREMAAYARDALKIAVEIALEHFDTARIAAICGMDLPMTQAERMQMAAQAQMAREQHAATMDAYAQLQQAGVQGLPPPPPEPDIPAVPETSWEEIHATLRDDFGRQITLTIETDSTILADESDDRQARIEFLVAFTDMVQRLLPLAGTGIFDGKTIKELLMFGVRGFRQARTLESLIASLPDEPQGSPPEDTAVTVAKIRAETDRMIEEMRQRNNEADRGHDMRMKGVDVMAEGIRMGGEQPQGESE